MVSRFLHVTYKSVLRNVIYLQRMTHAQVSTQMIAKTKIHRNRHYRDATMFRLKESYVQVTCLLMMKVLHNW